MQFVEMWLQGNQYDGVEYGQVVCSQEVVVVDQGLLVQDCCEQVDIDDMFEIEGNDV